MFGCHALAAGNRNVTDAGWAALSAGVRRNPDLALKQLWGVQLPKYDDSLPDHVGKDQEAVLSYYRARAQARVRRRVATIAVLRTAWHRSRGRPVRDGGSAEAQSTRAAKLAHMVQLRRLCRVREGKDEVVEPFGRSMVAYL